MQRYKSPFLLGALCFILIYLQPLAAYSEEMYQINVIIFSQLTSDSLGSEQWPLVPADEIAKLNQQQYQDVELLPIQQFQLDKELVKLKAHNHFKILMAVAWQASSLDLQSGQIIHLVGGANYDNDGNIVNSDKNNSAAEPSITHWQVNGSISIDLNRYFDVKVNLFFTEPINKIRKLTNNSYFDNFDRPFVSFQLSQTRRMRSEELNYIDYPLYGMLIKINPVVVSDNLQPPATSK